VSARNKKITRFSRFPFCHQGEEKIRKKGRGGHAAAKLFLGGKSPKGEEKRQQRALGEKGSTLTRYGGFSTEQGGGGGFRRDLLERKEIDGGKPSLRVK